MNHRSLLIPLLALPLCAASETLRYSVNWATGLSLGEASMTADNLDPKTAAGRKFEFRLEASIPGFAVSDEVRSISSAAFCSATAEKNLQHGKRISKETLSFDAASKKLERKTDKGGKSEVPVIDCAKDALAWLYFLRNELRNGRLPAPGPVYFGAAYQVDIKHSGPSSLTIAGAREEADKFQVNIKGPASQHSLELFVARDAARTPLLFRLPLPIGSFSMELLR